MASTNSGLRGLFARLSIAPSSFPTTRLTTTFPTTTTTTSLRNGGFAASRSLHTTPARAAKDSGSKKKSKRKKKGEAEPDVRIVNLKSSMPRVVPAPLRFARNRYLRHWTIHRAWLLFQRKEREARQKELSRMYQSMQAACEELRKTSGPGLRDEGYLYRVAQEKKGLYGHGGIPIEYARAQTETPAREPWNHDWTQ